MRKSILVLTLCACFSFNVKAQDNMLFNHMSVGLSLGVLDGMGLEVAAPLGNYVNVRTGFSFLPFAKAKPDGIKVYHEIAPGDHDIQEIKDDLGCEEVKADVKLKNNNWKLLFDIHPFKESSFRFTVGAYVGNSEFVSAKNIDPISKYEGAFIKVGDRRLGFDHNGFTKAHIKVNNFRPYLGWGFGRAISQNKKFVFNFDMGVSFWGKPKVYGYDVWNDEMTELKESDLEDEADAKKALKTLSKINVCPTIGVRFVYNIF